jgi:hypothetical protein
MYGSKKCNLNRKPEYSVPERWLRDVVTSWLHVSYTRHILITNANMGTGRTELLYRRTAQAAQTHTNRISFTICMDSPTDVKHTLFKKTTHAFQLTSMWSAKLSTSTAEHCVTTIINSLDINHFPFFYLKQCFGEWTLLRPEIVPRLHTPWLLSASELYRPSDRRLSAKLVPTFADRGCPVVTATNPHGC